MWPAYLDKVSKDCHRQLWDPGSGTTVLKSAVDVEAPKKGVVCTFGQRIQNSKVHGLVSHVIQGPHQDKSVACLDKKLEGHAT